jgi:hypothetical protein
LNNEEREGETGILKIRRDLPRVGGLHESQQNQNEKENQERYLPTHPDKQ